MEQEQLIDGLPLSEVKSKALEGKAKWQEVLNKISAFESATTAAEIEAAFLDAKDFDASAQS